MSLPIAARRPLLPTALAEPLPRQVNTPMVQNPMARSLGVQATPLQDPLRPPSATGGFSGGLTTVTAPNPQVSFGGYSGVSTFEQGPFRGPSAEMGGSGRAQWGATGAGGRLDGHMGAGVGGVSVQGELPGGIQGEAYAEGPSISLDGHADASVGATGLNISLGLDVDATLAEAGASGKKTIDFEVAGEKFSAELDLAAMGKIGAEGRINLDVKLGLTGASISARAEGFAGARAELSGGVTLKHNDDMLAQGKITASATAGVGGDAHADLSLEGGKVKFDVGAEATTGVGFGLDVTGQVDVGATAKAVGDVLKVNAEKIVEDVKEGAGKVVEEVKEGAGKVVEEVKEGADKVIEDVKDGAGKAIDKVGDFFKGLF